MGKNQLSSDENGHSYISMEDYACCHAFRKLEPAAREAAIQLRRPKNKVVVLALQVPSTRNGIWHN